MRQCKNMDGLHFIESQTICPLALEKRTVGMPCISEHTYSDQTAIFDYYYIQIYDNEESNQI